MSTPKPSPQQVATEPLVSRQIKIKLAKKEIAKIEVIDTDFVITQTNGKKLLIRDGALQAMLHPEFSLQFNDAAVVGQQVIQNSGSFNFESVALLTGRDESAMVSEQRVTSQPGTDLSAVTQSNKLPDQAGKSFDGSVAVRPESHGVVGSGLPKAVEATPEATAVAVAPVAGAAPSVGAVATTVAAAPAAAAASSAGFFASINPAWGALGALGLVGRGAGGDTVTNVLGSNGATTSTFYNLLINAVLGQVNTALEYYVYSSSGEILDRGQMTTSGTVTAQIKSTYKGPILVKVLDPTPNDKQGYLDEATNTSKDFSEIRAIFNATNFQDGSTTTINITPLTELAFRLSGSASTAANATTANIGSANSKVAALIGITSSTAIVTEKGLYALNSSSAPTKEGNALTYSRALAALSGYDTKGSMEETIKKLKAAYDAALGGFKEEEVAAILLDGMQIGMKGLVGAEKQTEDEALKAIQSVQDKYSTHAPVAIVGGNEAVLNSKSEKNFIKLSFTEAKDFTTDEKKKGLLQHLLIDGATALSATWVKTENDRLISLDGIIGSSDGKVWTILLNNQFSGLKTDADMLLNFKYDDGISRSPLLSIGIGTNTPSIKSSGLAGSSQSTTDPNLTSDTTPVYQINSIAGLKSVIAVFTNEKQDGEQTITTTREMTLLESSPGTYSVEFNNSTSLFSGVWTVKVSMSDKYGNTIEDLDGQQFEVRTSIPTPVFQELSGWDTGAPIEFNADGSVSQYSAGTTTDNKTHVTKFKVSTIAGTDVKMLIDAKEFGSTSSVVTTPGFADYFFEYDFSRSRALGDLNGITTGLLKAVQFKIKDPSNNEWKFITGPTVTFDTMAPELTRDGADLIANVYAMSENTSTDNARRSIALFGKDGANVDIISWGVSGTDANFFEVNQAEKKLYFKNSMTSNQLDYESDQNTYQIKLTAYDDVGNETTKDIQINVVNQEEQPTQPDLPKQQFSEGGDGQGAEKRINLLNGATDPEGKPVALKSGSVKFKYVDGNDVIESATLQGFTTEWTRGQLIVDLNDASFNGLKPGNTKSIEVLYTLVDEAQQTTNKSVTVEITGTNDAPTCQNLNPTWDSLSEDAYTVITYSDLCNLIGVTDPEGDPVTIKIYSVPNGTLLRQKASESAWSDVSPSSDRTVSAGDLLKWKAALNAFGEIEAFKLTVTDGSNENSTIVTVKANVAAVNDAPYFGTNPSNPPLCAEDTALEITFEKLIEWSAAYDVDDKDNQLTFEITEITSGSLKKLVDNTWQNVNLSGSTSTNHTLKSGEKWEWKPNDNQFGSGISAFKVKVSDSHGLSSTSQFQVKVNVTGVNDAPTLSSLASSVDFIEKSGRDDRSSAIAVNTGLTIVEVDGPSEIQEAQVNIFSAKSGDELLFTDTDSIVGVYSNGTLTLKAKTGKSPSNGDFQTALQAVKFNNTSDTPDTTPRTIKFMVKDATSWSNEVTSTVTVRATNDPLELNFSNSNDPRTVIFQETNGPDAGTNWVNFVDANYLNPLRDPDGSDSVKPELQVSFKIDQVKDGDRLKLGDLSTIDLYNFSSLNGTVSVNGMRWSWTCTSNTTEGTRSISFTSADTNLKSIALEVMNALLRSLQFNNNKDQPIAGTREFTFRVQNSQANSASDQVNVQVEKAPAINELKAWVMRTQALAEGGKETFVMAGDQLARLHTFSVASSGQMFKNNSTQSLDLNYLLVGGGGAAGGNNWSRSGGGGGGQVVSGTSALAASNVQTIVVGEGGKWTPSSTYATPADGGRTEGFGQTANGGSGAKGDSSGFGLNGGNTTFFNGGSNSGGLGNGVSQGGGGGGAGAGAAGGIAVKTSGGNGGSGVRSDITGSFVTYGSGGGGAAGQGGAAGVGGSDSGGSGSAVVTTTGVGNQVVGNVAQDTLAPTYVDSVRAKNAGVGGVTKTVIEMAFSELLDPSFTDGSRFTIKNETRNLDLAPDRVSVLGNVVTIELNSSSAVAATDDLRLSYTDKTPGPDLTGVIQDLAGNDLPTFSNLKVTTSTLDETQSDTVGPALIKVSMNATGDTLIFAFNEMLSSIGPKASQFIVQDATLFKTLTVDSVTVVGASVHVKLQDPIPKGNIISYSYTDATNTTDPFLNDIQDLAGNDFASIKPPSGGGSTVFNHVLFSAANGKDGLGGGGGGASGVGGMNMGGQGGSGAAMVRYDAALNEQDMVVLLKDIFTVDNSFNPTNGWRRYLTSDDDIQIDKLATIFNWLEAKAANTSDWTAQSVNALLNQMVVAA